MTIDIVRTNTTPAACYQPESPLIPTFRLQPLLQIGLVDAENRRKKNDQTLKEKTRPISASQGKLTLPNLSVKGTENNGVRGNLLELSNVIVMAEQAIISYQTGLMTTGANILINDLEVRVEHRWILFARLECGGIVVGAFAPGILQAH